MSEERDMPCVLKIGDTKLVMPVTKALRFMQLLLQEDLREWTRDYKKDATTGNYGYVEAIKPLDPDRLSVGYISPAKYIQYIAAGEAE